VEIQQPDELIIDPVGAPQPGGQLQVRLARCGRPLVVDQTELCVAEPNISRNTRRFASSGRRLPFSQRDNAVLTDSCPPTAMLSRWAIRTNRTAACGWLHCRC